MIDLTNLPVAGAKPSEVSSPHEQDLQTSVRVQAVSKFYPTPKGSARKGEPTRVAANKSISLEIKRGEIFGLLGPNGAGKTTLVNQILGLTPPEPDGGSIMVEGIDVVRFPDRIKELSSYLPQASMNFGTIEVQRLLLHAGELRGLKRAQAREQASDLIQELDLGEVSGRYFSGLSGGMKRVVGLALAFMGRPRLLVLDEPTNELDPGRRRQVWNFIRSSRATRGTTCLIVTHNVLEAEAVLERVAVIVGGEIKLIGTPGELKQQFSKEVRLEILLKQLPLNFSPTSQSQVGLDTGLSRPVSTVGFVREAFETTPLAKLLRIVPGQTNPLSLSIYAPVDHSDELLAILLHKVGLAYIDDFKLALPSLEEVYLDLVNSLSLSLKNTAEVKNEQI